MAERIGDAPSTLARMEKGDASVGFVAYAIAMFVLDLGHGRITTPSASPRRIQSL